MARMSGRVDDGLRPLLRLMVPDGNSFLTHIDTGFNGELWFARADAVTCGVEFDQVDERVGYLAGMRPVRETIGQLRILWFGIERVVDVVVDLDSAHRTVSPDEPMALIGTALLAPATMTVNFGKRRLTLRGT